MEMILDVSNQEKMGTWGWGRHTYQFCLQTLVSCPPGHSLDDLCGKKKGEKFFGLEEAFQRMKRETKRRQIYVSSGKWKGLKAKKQ